MITKFKQCHLCPKGVLRPIWKTEGRLHYCRVHWAQITPSAIGLSAIRKTGIKKVSSVMAVRNKEYATIRKGYLKTHTTCKARVAGCSYSATDVHHKAGRGVNYLNVATWLPVCRSCHDWIEKHPKEAKEKGFSQNRLS